MEHSTTVWRALVKSTALTTTLALALSMMLLLLLAAIPAYAQGPATATGVLEKAAAHSPDPTPVYAITDEVTGTPYELVSGFVNLEQYVGERVTIQGAPVPGPGDPSKPPLLNVTQIQPADGGENPPVNDKATLSFELTVDGDPPADAAFYGHVHTGEGGPGRYVPLTDSDGDRVYTGSTVVDRFGPGPRPVPPSVEPVSLPVKVVQEVNSAEGIEVIKDFGTVKLDGDKTFETSVSFPVDDCPIISPTPELCNGSGSGGGGSGSGNSDDSGSSSGGDAIGGGGSGSGGPDSGSVSDRVSDVTDGMRGSLPNTGGGGLALWVLGAGSFIVGGGLLIRRLAR